MTREDITRDIAARFNNGEGTVKDLATEYGTNYNRDKYNRDSIKYGIVKDKDTDKYIIPDKVMSGQIDILSPTVEPESREGVKVINTMTNIDTTQQGVKDMPENTLEGVKVNNEPPIMGESKVKEFVEPMERKKKTFEIDIDLEQLIRVQAAILDITINDYVNTVLRQSISDNVKSIIK